jgi:hypothetical protein
MAPSTVIHGAAGTSPDDAIVVLLLALVRAKPKSVTRARPSSPTRTLSGLKSR